MDRFRLSLTKPKLMHISDDPIYACTTSFSFWHISPISSIINERNRSPNENCIGIASRTMHTLGITFEPTRLFLGRSKSVAIMQLHSPYMFMFEKRGHLRRPWWSGITAMTAYNWGLSEASDRSTTLLRINFDCRRWPP